MKKLAFAFLGLGTAISSCAPRIEEARSQWVIHIGTDAPVPQFGDRLLVEVLDASGAPCESCRREFGVAAADAWPVSFGVEPIAGQSAPSIRVTLYRATTVGDDGLPGTDRRIEALVHLPPADGVVHVGLTLAMKCFGSLSGFASDASCDPETGMTMTAPRLDPSTDALSVEAKLPKVASWAPARDKPCDAPPESGMVCVPGGVFLLGRFPTTPLTGIPGVPEQLVRLDPYYLDANEMTVGQMRALVAAGKVQAPPSSAITPTCTYTSAVTSSSEDFPVNCVSLDQARAACAALGKHLPTEAQWEFAAGNRGRETTYPWIAPEGPCDAALVGNGDPANLQASQACEKVDPTPGLASETETNTNDDVTELGIRNLGGSLAEWIDDSLLGYSDTSCWGSDPGLRINPHCVSGQAPEVRGGAWATDPELSQSSQRDATTTPDGRDTTGFRCAK